MKTKSNTLSGLVCVVLLFAVSQVSGQVLVYHGSVNGPVVLGGLDVNSGTNFDISGQVAPPTFFFMDVEPTTGRVFAFDGTSATGSFAANLITVRRDGTVGSVIGAPNDNPVFANGISGFAFHPQNGEAFAINGGNLVSVNTTTAQFSQIGTTQLNGDNLSVSAIAFSPTGELFGLGVSTNPFVAPPPVGYNLYRIDTSTAELSFVGPSGFPVGTSGGDGFFPTDSAFTEDGRFFVGNLLRIGLAPETAIIELSPQTGGVIDTFSTLTFNELGNSSAPPDRNMDARGLVRIPGLNERDPILPQPGTGDFPDVPVPAGEGAWYDPVAAEGFIFEAFEGASFTEVGLPTSVPDNDGLYTITDDVNGTIVVAAGDVHTFPNPVSVFRIAGIDPTVDGDDPFAFPTFLVFDQDTPSFRMTPFGVSTVPEPSALVLWCLIGAAAFVLGRHFTSDKRP